MTDEKYTFVEDCREKKRTASGAFHKRTHAGKGGRVKFPSDYKTKKELRAMNGEVHSYKLNKPMSWSEFKEMPNDLKVDYIKGLRKSFGVPNLHIAKMFGVSAPTVMRLCEKLDISNERKKGNRSAWNKEAFEVWCKGDTQSDVEGAVPSNKYNPFDISVKKEALEVCGHHIIENIGHFEGSVHELEKLKTKLDKLAAKSVMPYDGHMTFDECTIDQAADMVRKIIGDKKVGLTISWTVESED